MDWNLFLSVFLVVFLAELPDKTTLTAIFLTAKQDVKGLFLGAAAALTFHSLIAVTLGSLLLRFLPPQPVRVAAGILFLVFAFLTWRESGHIRHNETRPADAPNDGRFLAAFGTSFGLIFLAEWGDMTQLATMTFAAKYPAAVTVFLASASALCSVNAMAIFLGSALKNKLPRPLFQKLAAVVFMGVGIFLLVRP